MHNIEQITKENRNEAIEIVKSKGGKIYFVSNIIKNSPYDDEQDDCRVLPDNVEIPIVIVPYGDGYQEVGVIGVKVDKIGNLYFLLFDYLENYCLGWSLYTDAVANTENSVYEFIEKLK